MDTDKDNGHSPRTKVDGGQWWRTDIHLLLKGMRSEAMFTRNRVQIPDQTDLQG